MDSCAGPSSGMHSLMKHMDKDPIKDGFQRQPPLVRDDKVMNIRPIRGADFNESLVDDFLAQSHPPPAPHDAFQFGHVQNELHQMLEAQHGPPGSQEWATEFHHPSFHPNEKLKARMMADPEMERAFQQASVRSAVDPSAAAHWSNEFISGGGATSGLSNRNCHSLIDEFTQFQATGGGGASATIVNPELDAEWSKQFDSIRDSLIQGGGGVSSPASATQVLDHEQQKKWDEEFQEILKTPGTILQENVSSLDGVDLDWAAQFSNTWKNGSASTSSNEEDNWYSDFDQFLENRGPALASPDVDPDPISGPLQPYTFETENPYLSHPNPMEEGLALLNTGGSLSSAALAFEAVVQRDRNSSEAWMRLGMVQAENEKEHPAIAALQRSVKENNLNEKALMSLAVSYTNEGTDSQALATLERWIRVSYPSIASSEPELVDIMAMPSEQRHERVTRLFLEAARQGPKSRNAIGGGGESSVEPIDPDVQVGLGVLFYNTGDYAKSVDCFNSALSARPNDYRLWNRLGATLANSGRSEEAIDAYYRALEINPSFVRGRYNLGVSCINIGCYKEAAEHLLGALSMHVVDGQSPTISSDPSGGNNGHKNVSQNLWDTLRRTFILMGRRELSDMALVSQNVDQFRSEFEF